MSTEMELTLEQTQQGVSYEVSVDPHGFEDKEFQRSFCHSDTERLSRSDEVLKLKNFKKDATLKLFKSTNQESDLNGKHELFASVDIFPCTKPYVQTRIHLVDLEFLNPIVQCLINLLQSAVTKLVDLIEPHDHLNLIFIPKCDGPWRVNYCEVMLEIKSSGIPSRFGEEGQIDGIDQTGSWCRQVSLQEWLPQFCLAEAAVFEELGASVPVD
ncbi:hypothetical protein Tco_1155629 [Tanacetum coccineum]